MPWERMLRGSFLSQLHARTATTVCSSGSMLPSTNAGCSLLCIMTTRSVGLGQRNLDAAIHPSRRRAACATVLSECPGGVRLLVSQVEKAAMRIDKAAEGRAEVAYDAAELEEKKKTAAEKGTQESGSGKHSGGKSQGGKGSSKSRTPSGKSSWNDSNAYYNGVGDKSQGWKRDWSQASSSWHGNRAPPSDVMPPPNPRKAVWSTPPSAKHRKAS